MRTCSAPSRSMISVPDADDVAERAAADAPLELGDEIGRETAAETSETADRARRPSSPSGPSPNLCPARPRPSVRSAPAAHRTGMRVRPRYRAATSCPNPSDRSVGTLQRDAWRRCCRACCCPRHRTRAASGQLTDPDAVEHDDDDAGKDAQSGMVRRRSSSRPIAACRSSRWRA